jgi:hypothetical protein
LEAAGREYYEARKIIMTGNSQGLTLTYNRFNDPEERDSAILNLRLLHAAIDSVVVDAYGWTDLHPLAIHEREWEDDNGERPGPWRLRWPEEERDEVLARLLELNRRRKEDENQPTSRNSSSRGRRQRANAPLDAPSLLI